MKYVDYMNASPQQVFEWVKTGIMNKSDFIKWLDANKNDIHWIK